jgi:hypothetical protein
MLDKLWTYLLFGNRFCGIEHTSLENDSILVTLVKKSKKELNQEFSFKPQSIKEVCEKLSKNQHCSLVINNDKVLSKSLSSDQKDPIKLVNKAFANINIEDFYYEVLSEKNTHFISICRKDYMQTLVKKYLKHNIFITDISLGNSLISALKPFISTSEVLSSNARINLEDGSIVSIDKTQNGANEFYDINGIRVSNTEILSFSAAIQPILKNKSTLTNLRSRSEALLNDFKQARLFSQFLKFFGIFILVLLLINFLFFNHYFNKVNDLQEITRINESAKQKILLLDKSVSKKEKLVGDLLKNSDSKSSLYVSSTVNSLPETILLMELNYQPLIKRIKPDKPIVLDSSTILVSGRSNESKLFSNWIADLEEFDWVKKVDIINYGLDSNLSSDFQIKITLAND